MDRSTILEWEVERLVVERRQFQPFDRALPRLHLLRFVGKERTRPPREIALQCEPRWPAADGNGAIDDDDLVDPLRDLCELGGRLDLLALAVDEPKVGPAVQIPDEARHSPRHLRVIGPNRPPLEPQNASYRTTSQAVAVTQDTGRCSPS